MQEPQVDPLAVAATAGAVAQSVRLMADSVHKFASEVVLARLEKLQSKKRENAHQFLSTFSAQIETGPTRNLTQKDVESAFEDPDFMGMLEDCLKSATRTSELEHHQVLAGLVVARFGVNRFDNMSLAAKAAVSIVPNLASRHLRVLGLMAAVHHLTPDEADISSRPEPRYINWFIDHFGIYSTIQFDNTDLGLLQSLSLIVPHQAQRVPLHLNFPTLPDYTAPINFDTLQSTAVYQAVSKVCLGPLDFARLTTTGLAIGRLVDVHLSGVHGDFV